MVALALEMLQPSMLRYLVTKLGDSTLVLPFWRVVCLEENMVKDQLS